MFQIQSMFPFFLGVGNFTKGTIIKNNAILEHFHKGHPFVMRRATEHFCHVFGIAVHRTGHKRGTGGQRHLNGIKGFIDGPVGRRTGYMPLWGSG